MSWIAVLWLASVAVVVELAARAVEITDELDRDRSL